MIRKSSLWESLRDVSDTFPFIKAKEREFGTHTRGEHSGFKNTPTLASWILGEKSRLVSSYPLSYWEHSWWECVLENRRAKACPCRLGLSNLGKKIIWWRDYLALRARRSFGAFLWFHWTISLRRELEPWSELNKYLVRNILSDPEWSDVWFGFDFRKSKVSFLSLKFVSWTEWVQGGDTISVTSVSGDIGREESVDWVEKSTDI